MEKITYGNYPLLGYTSHHIDTPLGSLPIRSQTTAGADFIAESEGVEFLFSYLATHSGANKIKPHTNYYLRRDVIESLKKNPATETACVRAFFSRKVAPCTGLFIHGIDSQQVFVLLSEEETKEKKNLYGRYLATAIVQRNVLMAFEECFLSDTQLHLLTNPYLSDPNIIPADYIMFVLNFLTAYANKQGILLSPTFNATKEDIYAIGGNASSNHLE